jgi:hypothetical protein
VVNAVTFDEYVEQAARYSRTESESLRIGQAYMNMLIEVRPDLAEQVATGRRWIDPFYFDVNLDAFLTWLADNWG